MIKDWKDLEALIRKEEEELNLYYEILDLTKEYHYTKSISTATELADKLYKFNEIRGIKYL